VHEQLPVQPGSCQLLTTPFQWALWRERVTPCHHTRHFAHHPTVPAHWHDMPQLATQHCTSQWFSGNAELSARAAKAVVQTTLPLYQDPKPVSCNKTALLQACYALHLLITIMPLPVCWPHMKPPRQHLTTIDLHPPQHNCTTNTVNYMLLICRPTPTLVMLSGLP
jgi:DNA-binding transcriptional LysR family regulator